MTDMDSMDRAVEEAREELLISTPTSAGPGPRILAGMFNAAIMRFEAAVSAKARAEERERHREGLEWLKSALLAQIGSHVRPPFERARSSEEAGNGS